MSDKKYISEFLKNIPSLEKQKKKRKKSKYESDSDTDDSEA